MQCILSHRPGGFSPAVAATIRDFAEKHKRQAKGYEEIEVSLYENGIRRNIAFTGRELFSLRRPVAAGTRIDTVYLTAKQQLALVTKGQKHHCDSATYDENFWANPETWNRDYWIFGDKTITVYPDLEELRKHNEELANKAQTALETPPLEILDI